MARMNRRDVFAPNEVMVLHCVQRTVHGCADKILYYQPLLSFYQGKLHYRESASLVTGLFRRLIPRNLDSKHSQKAERNYDSIFRHRGLVALGDRLPTDESVGYFRMSLWDKDGQRSVETVGYCLVSQPGQAAIGAIPGGAIPGTHIIFGGWLKYSLAPTFRAPPI